MTNKTKVLCCEGCLSTCRNLSSLDRYINIFGNLPIMIIRLFIYRENFKDTLLCWECWRILINLHKFEQRIAKAQSILKSAIDSTSQLNKDTQCQLSTLTSVTKTSYDYNIIYEDCQNAIEKIEAEVKSEVVCESENVTEIDEVTNILINGEQEILSSWYFKVDAEILPVKGEKDEEIDLNYVNDDDHFTESNLKILMKNEKGHKFIPCKTNYTIIDLQDADLQNYIKKVPIDVEILQFRLNDLRQTRQYKCSSYKCEKCITPYRKKEVLERHIKKFHLESSGKYVCDVCHKRFYKKNTLSSHCSKHLYQYVCSFCNISHLSTKDIWRHIKYAHKKLFQCKKCGAKFEKCHMFYRHHRDLHQKYICDHCGKYFMRRYLIKNHLRRYHQLHKCPECPSTFKLLYSLTKHMSLKHVVKVSEEAYCVECNLQFDNIHLYTRHMKTSVKHRTRPGIPCPVCQKKYAKKIYMMNHYNLVHLQMTKYYCDKCSRYFLNGFRLRQHNNSVHDKKPPVKNKICPFCGRTFSTNKILTNHIRTHTGERPFECGVCSAAFAQKQALVSHTRSRHQM